MASECINVEALWAGRSHKMRDWSRNFRESRASQFGKRTIREHRERNAVFTDRRNGED